MRFALKQCQENINLMVTYYTYEYDVLERIRSQSFGAIIALWLHK